MKTIAGYSRNEVIGRYQWDVQYALHMDEGRAGMSLEGLRAMLLEALRTARLDFTIPA